MIIRFIKNIWNEIEKRDWEGGFFGFIAALGMAFLLLGSILELYGLVLTGSILLAIPILLILFLFFKNLVFDFLKDVWKKTKEEKENE